MKLFRLFGKKETKEEDTQEPISSFPPEPNTGETTAVYAEMKRKLSQTSMNLQETASRATQIEEHAKERKSMLPPIPEPKHAT